MPSRRGASIGRARGPWASSGCGRMRTISGGERMRIALTVPSLGREFGGPIDKARGLGDALRTLGHDVRVVGVGQSDAPGSVGLGMAASFHGTPIPRSVGRLRSVVRGADIVHVIGYRDPVGAIAARVSRSPGRPLVLGPAGMLTPRLRSFVLKRAFDARFGRAMLGAARTVVATSTVELADLVAA